MEFEEESIHFEDIVNAVFNAETYDNIRFAVVGKHQSGAGQQIPGIIQVQAQRDRKRNDGLFLGYVIFAAPDLRDKSNMHAALVGNGTYMNDAELFGYHVKRAIHMLTVAAYKGAEILVLGAFGCGAFQNDPKVVARAYKTALA